MSLEEDLTVLIDYEKYEERSHNRRFQRQLNSSNKTNQSSSRYPTLYPHSSSQVQNQDKVRDHRYDCEDKGIPKRIQSAIATKLTHKNLNKGFNFSSM